MPATVKVNRSSEYPSTSSEPSLTDERVFEKVFSRTDWAVMFILAQGGQTSARLRFHVGPGADVALPVQVDYSRPFAANDHEAWKAEYETSVHQPVFALPKDGTAAELNQSAEAWPPLDIEGLWLDDWFDPRDESLDPGFGYGYALEALDHDYRP